MIDSHCHLDFPELADNLKQILQNSRNLGVDRFIVPSVSQKNWHKVNKIAQENSGVYASFGTHPWFLPETNNTNDLKYFLETHQAVAIGECGLDFYHTNHNKTLQKQVFAEQLQLANKLNLPVIIHSRKAVDAVLQLIKLTKPPKGVLHGFTGSIEQAKIAIKHNFYLGVSGIICNPKASKIRRLVSKLPLKNLVLETDSPEQSPVKNKIGTPQDLLLIAQELAKLHNIEIAQILLQCTQNSIDCFNL